MAKKAINLTFDKMATDETDTKLLDVLLTDSRLSYRRVASKIGVSAATVMNRIKRLEKEGVIKGYTATLDYEKLGYDLDAIISIKIAKGKFFEVGKKLATLPSVAAVFDVTGNFDCIVICKFKNRRALDAFLKKVQMYDFVEATSTALILSTIKNAQIKP